MAKWNFMIRMGLKLFRVKMEKLNFSMIMDSRSLKMNKGIYTELIKTGMRHSFLQQVKSHTRIRRVTV